MLWPAAENHPVNRALQALHQIPFARQLQTKELVLTIIAETKLSNYGLLGSASWDDQDTMDYSGTLFGGGKSTRRDTSDRLRAANIRRRLLLTRAMQKCLLNAMENVRTGDVLGYTATPSDYLSRSSVQYAADNTPCVREPHRRFSRGDLSARDLRLQNLCIESLIAHPSRLVHRYQVFIPAPETPFPYHILLQHVLLPPLVIDLH